MTSFIWLLSPTQNFSRLSLLNSLYHLWNDFTQSPLLLPMSMPRKFSLMCSTLYQFLWYWVHHTIMSLFSFLDLEKGLCFFFFFPIFCNYSIQHSGWHTGDFNEWISYIVNSFSWLFLPYYPFRGLSRKINDCKYFLAVKHTFGGM